MTLGPGRGPFLKIRGPVRLTTAVTCGGFKAINDTAAAATWVDKTTIILLLLAAYYDVEEHSSHKPCWLS